MEIAIGIGVILFVVFFVAPAFVGFMAEKPEYEDSAYQNQGG